MKSLTDWNIDGLTVVNAKREPVGLVDSQDLPKLKMEQSFFRFDKLQGLISKIQGRCRYKLFLAGNPQATLRAGSETEM